MGVSGYLLGVDAGTSRIKAVLFDTDGNVKAHADRENDALVHRADPKHYEQSLDRIWELSALCIREVVCAADKPILAVGLTAQGDGCWLIDVQGNPVGDGLTWLDGRAAGELKGWQEQGIVAKYAAVSGSDLFPGSVAALLKWLDFHEPTALSRAVAILYCKDWIRYKLTGAIATDYSDASRSPYSLRDCSYSSELLELLGLAQHEKMLPNILQSTAIAGYVSKEASAVIGLPEGTPVATGAIDVIATGIGLGAVSPGDAYSILGTTSFNGIVADRHLIEDLVLQQGREGASVGATLGLDDGSLVVRAFAAMSGTTNLDWALSCLRISAEDGNPYLAAETAAEKIAPGGNGLLYLPYISPNGERAPFVDPNASGLFFGLKMGHTPAHLVRAVYEGVAYAMRDCYAASGQRPEVIHLAGGGSKSRLWPQIIADVTGSKVAVHPAGEYGALGAALLAGVAVGTYPDLQGAVDAQKNRGAREYTPVIESTKRYDSYFQLYKQLAQSQTEAWGIRANLLA